MTFLFVILAVTSVVIGDVHKGDKNVIDEVHESYDFDRYSLPEYISIEKYPNTNHYNDDLNPRIDGEDASRNIDQIILNELSTVKTSKTVMNGPMDSAWPMYCHDTRHTGRSLYSTVDTWDEIWRFDTVDWAQGDIVTDDDGTIYMGSTALYAVYPNGTLKWKYVTHFHIECAPALDENGIIYFGTIYGSPSYLYALCPNGTLKWKYSVGGVYSIFSSPAIGSDGTIYFGSGGDYPPTGRIKALYPNGSLKWEYKTNHVVYSSPAIGDDGTIYCGCHDTYLYALYPNNGTLKWKYKTGDWIRVSPCIGDDGTIYVVSLDYYLHTIYPNGTLKWKTNVGAGTSPTIGQDGTIYAGYRKLHAINPSNGSVKWTFDVGGTIRGGTPCNSVDGTIYVGTSDGGEIIAVNPDGTLKWRKGIGECESAPAIGEDGTIYIASNAGYLHAFGIGKLEADADGPYYGLIDSPVEFEGSSKGGYSPHTFHWDFGDGDTSEEQNPTYTYTDAGNYTVTLTVTDNTSNTSSDASWAWIQTSNDPPNRPAITGETNGNVGESYDYTFTTSDPDGSIICYYIDWGDNTNTGWLGPYNSGTTVTKSHTWSEKGNYTIRCKAKDPYDAEGEWGTLKVTMPKNQQISQQSSNLLLFQILERLMRI